MKQVLDLLAENSALKAELQRKEEVIQELKRTKVGRKWSSDWKRQKKGIDRSVKKR
jgi:hypothetical protein